MDATEQMPMFYTHGVVTVVLGAIRGPALPALLVFVDETANRGAGDFWLPGVVFLGHGIA